jgi:hypothetical protein
MTSEKHEVILAYNGKQCVYSDTEFSGSREECEDYIDDRLREQRETPGMANSGTFLLIRNAQTREWIA